MRRKDTVIWSVPVTRKLDTAVEEAVKLDYHSTKAELIRDAVRRLLKELRSENVADMDAIKARVEKASAKEVIMTPQNIEALKQEVLEALARLEQMDIDG